MKKTVLLLLLTPLALLAVDGFKVYQAKCSMCHNQMKTTKEVMDNIKTMKAPPMMEVSNRLKDMIQLKEEDEDIKRELILTFMRDYIMNPDIEKSMCHMGALDRFGVMPSQKGKLTQEELVAVTQWLYDHYEGKEFK